MKYSEARGISLMIISFHCLMIHHCQLILHVNDDGYDCLYYRISTEKLAYQELANIIQETIPYCFRPTNESEKILAKYSFFNDRKWSFEELLLSNISVGDLLSWSSSIDLVEKYQFYLNENDSSLSNEFFYNCTKPWFGRECQYSFEYSTQMSINSVVENEFSQKSSYSELMNMSIPFPCYIHLKCDRGGLNLCLDWREICNGYIDCIDEGLDEAFCFDMELNECEENEYRCHNGLCIPEQFWEYGLADADCLDRSDEFGDVKYPKSCFRDPTFRCEEHSCRTNWHDFPCGDGECVQIFDQCQNGRHHYLIQSMIIDETLSDQCFTGMMCLTKLIEEMKGIRCETLMENNLLFHFLQSCKSLFQFPSNPIYFGHIRFLYENISLKSNINSLIIPDYICYDPQLCDCLHGTFFYENLTCILSNQLDLISSVSGDIWLDMILSIETSFRSCLSSNHRTKHENSSSLYQCINSSKVISKHRIYDENIDCCMKDDENVEISCSIEDKHRVQCSEKDQCLSSLHTKDDCPSNENVLEKKLPFRNICDGLGEVLFKDSDGKIRTDESDCDHWPCDNLYSRCDGFWTCPNGEDEENCLHPHLCPRGSHPCLSSWNYSLICLSSIQIDDGINDCLGSTDEQHFCRRVYPSEKDAKRFRCQNSDLCLSSLELCNNIQSCPQGDDENFCGNQRFICEKTFKSNRTILEDILCRLTEDEQNRIVHFSIQTSSNYPQSIQTLPWKSEQRHSIKDHIDQKRNSSWPWYCNRGLTIRMRSDHRRRCLCPPSYYGHFCEYQNERVSLTLGLVRAERRDLYIIVIMLMSNDDNNIHSFDQFEYVASQSCGMKFNRYLLYSDRPKNISKIYSVRIDVFEKHRMTYDGSWYLSIPFPFLPVNRLSALLVLPFEQSLLSRNCSTQCEHGQCIQYVNIAKSFCRCFSGWSGVRCDISINCQDCSFDSLCIGSIKNRSICICPLTKYGPQCLLISSCPLNACENAGQCIPADRSVSGSDYSCICSNEYYGSRCEYLKAKLDLSLENLNNPSFLLAFFFTVSNQSEPTVTIILHKLTLFQRTVIFRISIPYHIVVVQSTKKYYLAVVQQVARADISTSIDPSRECLSIELLLNSTTMKLPQFQRIKYYHIPCQLSSQLNCFHDELYLCLCTKERHANCLEFSTHRNLQCSSKHSCFNGGQCLQDHPTCPSAIICVCTDCFFGDQCQFYAKGLGLTLDEILGYEMKPHLSLSEQSFPVQLSAALTMIMFLAGSISAVLSIVTFQTRPCREVGCGIYLLLSSIISLAIVILFTLKFWFLIYSYGDFLSRRLILFANCMIIEPLLKAFLHINNWLNGCVASERAFAVFKGISFDKKRSRQLAKWMIMAIITINVLFFIPQMLNLHLFDDKKEERTWCVVRYSSLLDNYSSFLLFFHIFAPFLVNFFSALCIIVGTTRQRVLTENEHRFTNHFKTKLNQHKHLLISPIILMILSLPRLIISFTLDCRKSSQHFWLYLFGYFVSFLPSILIFIVFVLPSRIYKNEFKHALVRLRRSFLVSNRDI